MFEEMVKCQDLFRKFGGHPMAAGFSLPRSRIDEMRRRLNENCTMTEEDRAEKIMVDVPMPINYIRESLVEELAVLEDRLIYMQLRLDAPITDEYIRRIAREKLNYRDPDEILFYNDLAD